ncbi:hypothetical protein OF83DRAFT_1177913 [Amylostereum chailletii]|nr:hypothetical protein OF83DRAFT_1177913 [Amylostereum chailletii]
MSNAMHPKTKTFLRECILEIEKDDGSAEMASHLLYWSDDDDYYVLSTPAYERKDLETLSERAMLIPKIFYLAVIPNDLTIAPIPPPSDSFLKVVDPLVFVPEINSEKHPTDGADIIVQEARVYERYLLKHPHPHICEYYGYVPTEDGRLKGLCIKRHKKDLREAVKVGELLDVDKIVEGIRSGLTHLHSLGLVHYITPRPSRKKDINDKDKRCETLDVLSALRIKFFTVD